MLFFLTGKERKFNYETQQFKNHSTDNQFLNSKTFNQCQPPVYISLSRDNSKSSKTYPSEKGIN